MQKNKRYAVLGFAAIASMVLAACAPAGGAAAPKVIETVVVEVTKEVVKENTVEKTVEKVVEVTAAPKPEWTTAHPILGDVKVRQAIAHCTNREALVGVSYPFLSDEEKGKLLMDTWIPKSSPFYAEPSVQYTFDITKAGTLLDEAGWKKPEGGNVRANANGEPLVLRFTTTNAQFRQTWAAVFEKQMAACGIIVQRSHIPGSIWFGGSSGLRRRDFDMGAFAWVGEPDPGGESLYTCDNIPTPANNWKGQNYMGWCNEAANQAIRDANNSLSVDARKAAYKIHQDEFAKDMISLPVFQRAEAGAYNNKLKGVKFNPTEYYSASADEWAGKDTVVLAFTQEPASMFSLVESAAVQRTVAQMVFGAGVTAYDYGYQTDEYEGDAFPTIENGGATNSEVDLKDGDKFVASDGSVYQLKDGKVVDLEGKDAADIKVKNAKGEEQPAAVGAKAPQIVVTFKHKADKWSDGEAVKKADRELSFKINCDKTSGATSYDTCDRIAGVEFIDDNSYKTTFVPGYQNFFYYLSGSMGAYPSHQVINSDGAYKGKTLAEVAAKDFATLPEIAELPIGAGPYILKEWKRGENMTLEANPNYRGGAPKVKKVIVRFYADTTGAVAALLNGEADVVGTETLGAGTEVESVIKAKSEGKAIEVFTQATPTWEHIDFNLNVR
jgi:ABC-type transport system substrate-binding protein